MERTKPLISVIMSTYREDEQFLRKAIESILIQTYTEFEFLIVADDPKNNELIEILREYEKKDARIHIYINKKNMGLANSLNALLKVAQGEFIARMDADDISMPDRLENQIVYMRQHQADVISCDVDVIDENEKSAIGRSENKKEIVCK